MQVNNLLEERNEIRSRFDQLARQKGADLTSEGASEINQHFLLTNEELKETNQVKQLSWNSGLPVILIVNLAFPVSRLLFPSQNWEDRTDVSAVEFQFL